MNRLDEEIRDKSESKKAPDGRRYRSISAADVRELSHGHKCSLKEIEILSLKHGVAPERYQRNLGSVGMEGQARLLESKVAIVGLGGLGGFVFELLLRTGIGEITAIDGDEFSESNLNRQLLSRTTNMGIPKVEVARQSAATINPSTKVETYHAWANEGNLAEMIEGSQAVVDGLDDIRVRYIVQRVAKSVGIPFIHGAVAGFWGQVMTIFPEDKGLELIYGSESDSTPGDEGELGTPCVTPATIAALQVSEVVKVILGWRDVIRNRLFVLNLRNLATGYVDLT